MHFHMYMNGKHVGLVDIDVLLQYKVRNQVLVKDQDHMDLIKGMELVLSTEVRYKSLLSDWKARVRQHRGQLSLLPVVFTTWRVQPADELWMS